MLLIEILRTVGQLAEAVAQKTAEVDKLKKDYEKKLATVNKYIELLTSHNANNDVLSEDKAMELIEKDITCPHCHKNVNSLQENPDYVVVPRKKIHVPQQSARDVANQLHQLTLDTQKVRQDITTHEEKDPVSGPKDLPKDSIPKEPKKHHGGKLKRTCSYCKQPGHSRARCFKRLTKDPSS